MYFKHFFPHYHMSPTFNKTNILHNDLKNDVMNQIGIKY